MAVSSLECRPIPSHASPECPGSIHEGGELGYSLSHAFGAVFDNPDLVVACVVGDGEAETGPLATAWHSNKFLNPVSDGAVLPILHLNGYKIANPTLLARITREELEQLLRGYGWTPYFVEGYESGPMHQAMAVTSNADQRNFRIFGPDETLSNGLEAVFGATARQWEAATVPNDEFLAPTGRVMEMLSEHQCEGWLEGYLLTGRHGLFNCYEAFIHIVDSMFNQHAKWLKVAAGLPWRRKIASLNYLLASHVWRQDHNGFTHQDPDFIDHVVNKKADVVRVYLPPDANCLLSVMDHCLRSRHYVNVVIAGKHPAPQWLTMDAAVKHCTRGIGIWPWASNDQEAAPDVVMACCGDVPTLETLAAVSIMREHLPELRIRVVNVVDLMKLQPTTEHPHGLSDKDFDELFTVDKPIIFAFHAYPWLIHRLTYRRTNHANLHVRGYKEEGTITTPFDMTVLNDLDRFHLVMDAIDRLPQTGDRGVYLKQRLADKLIEHREYIDKYGEDLPEIRHWKWAATGAHYSENS